jgi:hypothetical protein
LTVDLFGEQTVEAMANSLQVALMLLAGVVLLLLAVHLATSAVEKPVLARITWHTGRLVTPPDSHGNVQRIGLRTSLPTRAPPCGDAPPGSSPPQWFSPAPPGDDALSPR